jgi:mRNA interferase MazF
VKRGDVIRVAGSGNFAGKPRPAVIVQADEYCDAHESLTVVPLTSMLQPSFAFRVHVHANAANGLNADSDAEVDKVQAVKRHRTRGVIGEVDVWAMARIDDALRQWLSV